MFRKNRIEAIIPELELLLGKENVCTGEAEIVSYSYDSGLSMARPEAVLFFDKISQISPAVKILAKHKIPFTARMSGTNITGGTITLRGGVVLNLSRLNKIIYVSPEKEEVLVESGVINGDLQRALRPFGFFFAPNPASADVCTVGGNIAENSSGTRWLAYGSARDSVIQLEVVTPDGETHIWKTNGSAPDLMGLVPGSEGTLGIITRAWLRINKIPAFIKTFAYAFPTLDNALEAAEDMLSEGLGLQSLEILDKTALDASLKKKTFSFPHTTRALLIADIAHGDSLAIDECSDRINAICKDRKFLSMESAEDENGRNRIWDIRKRAFPSMAKIAPDIVLEESCVPREKLLAAVKKTRDILRTYRLVSGLIISPGAGSIQPHIAFDRRVLQDLRRVKTARSMLIQECLSLGGSVAGDYGIGVDKRLLLNWLYSPEELDFLHKIKKAFDPLDIANPDKILPVNEDDAMFDTAEKNINKPDLDPHIHTLLATLRSRADNRISSVVLGTGTQLKTPPESEKLKILNTRFLTMPPEINKVNRTVKAGAGIKMSDLRSILNVEGLDVQIPEAEGTLGGIIASGRIPQISKILLGMEIATAEGIYMNFTQQTLKAATGYDISSIFCGSRGAYGVILSVVLQTCKAEEKKNFIKPEIVPFAPEKIHIAFKKEADPENLLNPWLYPNILEGDR